jgi:hypothetical protein
MAARVEPLPQRINGAIPRSCRGSGRDGATQLEAVGELVRRIEGNGLMGFYAIGQPLKTHGQGEQLFAVVWKSRPLRE